MNLLDSRLTIYFEKLFIPIVENQEFIIDLRYEEDHYRFKYPMENPHIMPIKDPFTREKNVINMIIMIRVGKKYRKIAKAEINLYKKYFLTEKLGVDKWVHLELFETQLEQMGHNTNILKTVINTGKIYMKSQLIDPEIAEVSAGKSAFCDNMTIYTSTTQATAITQMLKNNLKNISNTKEKTATTRTEKYRSITEHTNEFLKNLKNRKLYSEDDLFEDIKEDEEEKREEFDDNVSDFSVSIIDGKEEKHEEINQSSLEIEFLIDRVKREFYDRFDNLVPEDPKEIKFFLQNISNFIVAIANSYTDNLKAMAEVSKKIREQAQDYYEKYKTLNKDFLKKRRELKAKTDSLNERNKANLEDNEKTKQNLADFDFEYKYFKEKIQIEISQDKEDINSMAAVLDSLVQEVNIFEGLEEEDALVVSEALNDYLHENKVSRPDYDRESQEMNLLVEKIKVIVNDLFEKKKISLMEMKYSENKIFSFGKKCVCLVLKDDVVYVNAENNNKILSDWLIENFPNTEKDDNRTEHKMVLTTQNNKSSPNKKDSQNSARMNTVNTPKVKSNNFNSFNDKKVTEKKPTIKNEKAAKNTKNNVVAKK